MSNSSTSERECSGPFALAQYFTQAVKAAQRPDETGASRLAEVAVLSLVASMQGGEKPITAADVARSLDLGHWMTQTIVMRLLDKGLLVRREGRDPKLGRSRAYYLRLADTPELRRALGRSEETAADPIEEERRATSKTDLLAAHAPPSPKKGDALLGRLGRLSSEGGSPAPAPKRRRKSSPEESPGKHAPRS